MLHRLAYATIAYLLLAASEQNVHAQGLAASLAPDAGAAFARAETALAKGEFAQAETEAEAVIKLAPDFVAGYNVLRHARLSQTTDLSAFAARFKAQAEGAPERAAYWYAYGRFVTDPAEQRRAFDKVVALAPASAWGYYGLGFAAKRAGDMKTAITLYEKAHRMAPAETDITSGLIDTYLQVSGRDADAMALLDELLKAAPQSYTARATLWWSCTVGPVERRGKLAERFIAAYPEGLFVGGAYSVYLEALRAKDPDAALAKARELLASGRPGPRGVWFGVLLGDAYGRGREGADALVKQVLAWHETDPTIFISLASLFSREPDYAERGEALHRQAIHVAESASPRDDKAVARIRTFYEYFQLDLLSRKDPEAAAARARELLRTAIAEDRGRLFSYVLNAAKLKGPQALDALAKEVLADESTSADILVSLALRYELASADAGVAAPLYARAITAMPAAGYPLEYAVDLQQRLAEAYTRLGRTSDAVAVLTSIDRKFDRGEISAALGRAYTRAGDTAKAYDAFARAAALDPNERTHTALVEAARAVGKTDADAAADVLALRERSAYPAPDFSLRALDGRQVSLESLRGKVVVLNFWFPGCGPCRMEFPHLQKLYARLSAKGVEVVAVDVTSDDGGARRFITASQITFPSLTGDTGSVATLYGVNATPTTFLIGRDGKVYYSTSGFGEASNLDALESVITSLLARPSATDSTAKP